MAAFLKNVFYLNVKFSYAIYMEKPRCLVRTPTALDSFMQGWVSTRRSCSPMPRALEQPPRALEHTPIVQQHPPRAREKPPRVLRAAASRVLRAATKSARAAAEAARAALAEITMMFGAEESS